MVGPKTVWERWLAQADQSGVARYTGHTLAQQTVGAVQIIIVGFGRGDPSAAPQARRPIGRLSR